MLKISPPPIQQIQQPLYKILSNLTLTGTLKGALKGTLKGTLIYIYIYIYIKILEEPKKPNIP